MCVFSFRMYLRSQTGFYFSFQPQVHQMFGPESQLVRVEWGPRQND